MMFRSLDECGLMTGCCCDRLILGLIPPFRGGWPRSGRVGFFKRQPDSLADAIELAIDFKVGEPEDFVSEVG
jgi:hypothetical protein